jgi:hypothetical protein
MGLAEQKLAGGILERKTTTFTTDVVGSGSVNFGASYVILSIDSSNPCRIRFYENTQSRDSASEITRTFGDTNIAADVALVGDFSMSAAGRYTTDPALYGVTHSGSLTYYRITPSTPTTLNITTYTIEDGNILPIGGQYTLNNRRNLPDFDESISVGTYVSGTLDSAIVPRTFLLVSASVSGANDVARIRLYSKSGSLVDATEISRSFSVEPSASAYLIADMILSASETTYFTPKIIGAGFKTLTNNMQPMLSSRAAIDSDNVIYYILENVGPTTNISASIHVFALED